MRVGYAELRVTPELKRLDGRAWRRCAPEYRPGDTARVAHPGARRARARVSAAR